VIQHNLRGRPVMPASAKLAVFNGFICDTATQYLTTDGFTFNVIPLKDGGMLTELEYASHKLYKPRTRVRNKDNVVDARYVFKLTVVDGQAKHKLTIVFQHAYSFAANLFLKLKQEDITVEELIDLHDMTARNFPATDKRWGSFSNWEMFY
jgi:hypothetical protein